jgi:hypothetical protein
MAILNAAIEEINTVLGQRMAFGRSDLNAEGSDVFGVLGVKNIKLREWTVSQLGNHLPMDLTMGVDIYAKNEVSYEDVIEYIDDNLLEPLLFNNFNVMGMSTSPLVYDSGLKMNVMKCEITFHWTYANYDVSGGEV